MLHRAAPPAVWDIAAWRYTKVRGVKGENAVKTKSCSFFEPLMEKLSFRLPVILRHYNRHIAAQGLLHHL